MSDEDAKKWEDNLRDKYGISSAISDHSDKEDFMDEFSLEVELAVERIDDGHKISFDEYLKAR